MALSTLQPQARKCNDNPVIYPVTPNGVEHMVGNYNNSDAQTVIYPVTPNGVEHVER